MSEVVEVKKNRKYTLNGKTPYGEELSKRKVKVTELRKVGRGYSVHFAPDEGAAFGPLPLKTFQQLAAKPAKR